MKSLQQETSHVPLQQEVNKSVPPSDQNVGQSPTDILQSDPASQQVTPEFSEKVQSLPDNVSDISSIEDLQELYHTSRQHLKELESVLKVKVQQLWDMTAVLEERDSTVTQLQQDKKDVEEKHTRDMQESEKSSKEAIGDLTSRLNTITQELEASREQEQVLEDQYDELQHQKKQELDSLRQDLLQEKHLDVGRLCYKYIKHITSKCTVVNRKIVE